MHIVRITASSVRMESKNASCVARRSAAASAIAFCAFCLSVTHIVWCDLKCKDDTRTTTSATQGVSRYFVRKSGIPVESTRREERPRTRYSTYGINQLFRSVALGDETIALGGYGR